jgi:hypothetical protein
MAKEKSGEKMYGKRIVSKGEGPDKKGKHHIRHKKRTHKSKGKAGIIPHPSGMSPHSGARKNKLQKELEAREKKVAKQRKKSKGSPAYTAIGLAAGAIPFVGKAAKTIPAIVKGVKTIKAGMKASKAKNPRGAMQQINPKSSLIKSNQSKVKSDVQKSLRTIKPKPKPTETLTRPNPRKKLSKKPTTPESKRNPGKEKLKRRMEGEQELRDSETGAYLEDMMEPAKFVRARKHSQKGRFKQKMKKQMKKAGGGRIKGYKKGGPISYRMTGGQVVDNSYD